MKAETTHVSGGCLCGRIRYEADVFLLNGYICHCTICRKSTGQPAEITVLIKAGTLRYIKGEPKYFVTSQSGKRGFCGECGSVLFWKGAGRDYTAIAAGSLDGPTGLKLEGHIFCESAGDYYEIAGGDYRRARWMKDS